MQLEFLCQTRVGPLSCLLAKILELRNLHDKLVFLLTQLLHRHRPNSPGSFGDCRQYDEPPWSTCLAHKHIAHAMQQLRQELIECPLEFPRQSYILVGKIPTDLEPESPCQVLNNFRGAGSICLHFDS